MGARKRREPPPLPPPLGGIVIDGSNVIASATVRADLRLQLAVAWFSSWRPDLEICVYIDHATVGRCAPAAQRSLQQRMDATDARVRYSLGPRGAAADPLVLEHAVTARALVVSNDRFADHERLRAGVVTVQFECQGDRFEPYAEATWFTPQGGAARVALATLRDLPRAGE